MEYGFWLGLLPPAPVILSLNICNNCIKNRAHKHSIWLCSCLNTSAYFILTLYVAMMFISSHNVLWPSLFFVLACICLGICILSWISWNKSKESNYWKLKYRCIRKSKTKWLFQIANDLYANQFMEAEEQRRKEEY